MCRREKVYVGLKCVRCRSITTRVAVMYGFTNDKLLLQIQRGVLVWSRVRSSAASDVYMRPH